MEGSPFGGSAESQPNKEKQLNQEQLQHLLNKISSDETKDLQTIMKDCTTQIMTTRALPATAIVLGSLYVSRTRLPPAYHFGPKGWPFYAIMGISTLTAVNVLSVSTCQERVRPKINQLWQKYSSEVGASTTNYSALRDKNRGRTIQPMGEGGEESGMSAALPDRNRRPTLQDRFGDAPPEMRSEFDLTATQPAAGERDDTYAPRVRYPPQGEFAYRDTFISGTPSGPPRSDGFGLDSGTQSEGKGKYGDSGFS